MSMSMHVVGFVPPDGEYEKKRAAYLACEAAAVEVPKELRQFFGWTEPSEHGYEVSEKDLGAGVAEWSDDYRQGFKIDLEKLPAKVKRLRVYCSW